MNDKKIISDFELAKLLMDPKRSRILAAAADEPVTVKQIAEKVGEVPSRLYYHVKKLEEAGILLAVETKQQGNLIERYYRTNIDRPTSFHFDKHMAAANSATIVQRIYSLVQTGIALLQKGMEQGDEHASLHADANISYSRKTYAEWLESQEKIARAITNKPEESLSTPSGGDSVQQNASVKEEYVYITLTYRLSDAEALKQHNDVDTE